MEIAITTNTSIIAQIFLHVYEGKSDDICSQIDKGRKELAVQNRQKLLPIVNTVIICGRQEIALRGHSDSGLIRREAKEEVDTSSNDGNLRALLRFRIESAMTCWKTT